MLYSKNGGEYMAKILIVEDDKRTNMAICEYLKPTGHNIVSAYDGEEALQLFHSTTIDLIVLDIMLPRLTGIAVLHEIRKSSLIPVLMLTAIEDEYTFFYGIAWKKNHRSFAPLWTNAVYRHYYFRGCYCQFFWIYSP